VVEPLAPLSAVLISLVKEAIQLAGKARRNNKSLAGNNFYGNKLAQMRSEATNAFADLPQSSLSDTTALAELIEVVFSPETSAPARLEASRELAHELQTKWKRGGPAPDKPGNELFPLALVTKTKRSYLVTVANQMNGCFREGWHDACAVMMRRLVEIALIEAFENKGVAHKIKDGNGDYLHLSDLIDRALAEQKLGLSRNTKKELPKLRSLGHRSAHGRYFTAQPGDLAKVEDAVRVVVEELLRQAGLL
jgi:hypothetical protein